MIVLSEAAVTQVNASAAAAASRGRKRLLSVANKLIGDVIEVIANDSRLRADPQNIVANTLDQSCGELPQS